MFPLIFSLKVKISTQEKVGNAKVNIQLCFFLLDFMYFHSASKQLFTYCL